MGCEVLKNPDRFYIIVKEYLSSFAGKAAGTGSSYYQNSW